MLAGLSAGVVDAVRLGDKVLEWLANNEGPPLLAIRHVTATILPVIRVLDRDCRVGHTEPLTDVVPPSAVGLTLKREGPKETVVVFVTSMPRSIIRTQ